MERLSAMYIRRTKCKLIEVCGFSDSNVIKFVEKQFVHDEVKSESMKEKLSVMEEIKSMARVPVYAKTICDIHDSGELSEEINTHTKLLLSACLVFLRNHMLKEAIPLSKVCEIEEVAPIVNCRNLVMASTFLQPPRSGC